jgi:hypothetical protein
MRENQSDFGQRFRLDAMEFTPRQEMKRKQDRSAAAIRRPGRDEDLRDVELAVVAIR